MPPLPQEANDGDVNGSEMFQRTKERLQSQPCVQGSNVDRVADSVARFQDAVLRTVVDRTLQARLSTDADGVVTEVRHPFSRMSQSQIHSQNRRI